MLLYLPESAPSDETVLNESLAAWLKEELHLRRLSQKLQQLLKREHSLGDLVLPILRRLII